MPARRTLLIPALLDDWFPLLQYAFTSDSWEPVLLTEDQGLPVLACGTSTTSFATLSFWWPDKCSPPWPPENTTPPGAVCSWARQGTSAGAPAASA